MPSLPYFPWLPLLIAPYCSKPGSNQRSYMDSGTLSLLVLQSQTRRRERFKSLALPNNLACFEGHESIEMMGDDSRGVVACGTRCGYLS